MELLCQSKTLEHMISDMHMGLGELEDSSRYEFPVMVKSTVFKKVVEWMREHKGKAFFIFGICSEIFRLADTCGEDRSNYS